MNDLNKLVNERVAALRPKLQDKGRRNPLIHNELKARSTSFIRIVDEKPQAVFDDLVVENKPMQMVPLPATNIDPADENTDEFRRVFANAQKIDEQYIAAIDEIDFENDDKAIDLQEVEDRKLKDRVRLLIGLPERTDAEATAVQELSAHARMHGINPSIELPSPDSDPGDERHHDNELQTLMLPKRFDGLLNHIANKAKTYKEERGLEVTFLVLGYLSWTLPHTEQAEHFKSPLVIIPVKVNHNITAHGSTFSIERTGEPQINPSLVHKLQEDASLELLPDSKDINEEHFDIEDFFSEIDGIKPKHMSWKVRREATLGIYPYSGIDLYSDLDPNQVNFADFPILSQLMLGAGESEGKDSIDTDDVESEQARRLVPELVMDADTSQLAALMKIAAGQNVALEGPPGSGKSQTIVNAIANTIRSGKRVLFVAQKATALEVVQSRLESLGLGQFVLPLMNLGKSSSNFYEAIGQRVNFTPALSHTPSKETAVALESRKQKLSNYIQVLTSKVKATDLTVHNVLGLATKHHQAIDELPNKIKLSRFDPGRFAADFNLDDLKEAVAKGKAWLADLSNCELAPDSPWHGFVSSASDANTIPRLLQQTEIGLLKVENATANLEEFETELFNYVSSLTLDKIRFLLDPADLSHFLQLSHSLSQTVGSQEAQKLVRALNAITLKLQSLSNDKWKKPERMSLLADRVEDLTSFNEWLTQSEVDTLSSNCIDHYIERLATQLPSIQKILSFEDKFNTLVTNRTSPSILALCTPLLKNHELLVEFENYILLNGFDGAERELNHARKLVREFNQLFQNQIIPSRSEIDNARELIKRSGIFAMFSAEYGRVTQLVRAWMGTEKVKYSKQETLQFLHNCSKLHSEWASIEISDLCQITDQAIDQKILSLLSIVECLKKISRQTDLDQKELTRLSAHPDCRDVLIEIGKSSLSSFCWEELAQKVSALSACEDYARDNKQWLTDMSHFCVRHDVTDPNNLIQLLTFAKLCRQLSETHKAITSDDPTSSFDLNFASNMTLAMTQYIGMSDQMRIIIFEDAANVLRTMLRELMPTLEELQQNVVHLETMRGASTQGNISVSFVLSQLDTYVASQNDIAKLFQARQVLGEAEQRGMRELLLQITNEDLRDHADATIMAAIVNSLKASAVEDFGAELLQYTGHSLTEARAELASLDKKIIHDSRLHIAHEIHSLAKPPTGNGKGYKRDFTEMSLIKNELGKKKNRVPARKIVKTRARTALNELFPCWMMGPADVPKYLPRTQIFDLVIIDEASQMTPEYSISALMRASNALIAGDTNQLPPTNFFKAGGDIDDEDDDISTPEESVLELANLTFTPKHKLLWHYRSAHEDLIRFSNYYVYDNELVIFPSPRPASKELGVSLRQIDAEYVRGINPGEAEVMLSAIVKFMEDTPHRSLGVAVMNQNQKEHIEVEFQRRIAQSPKVAQYISEWETKNSGLERFFIKNLENVQGDERDVIFIGTVYGKDTLGKFYQRFGPINGSAGKRRLNVLFTRAKEQIITFSSIPMALFQPSPSNEGSTLLKRWLEFCSTKRLGERILPHSRAGYTDSPFEDHVIEIVKDLGFEPVPQVGVSSYFIDIGIRHSTYPMGYICGVECDGATYHSAKSARDRDRLRDEVLGRLGWTLHRIWSTDWFRDPVGSRDKLKKFLEDTLTQKIKELGKHTILNEQAPPSPHTLDDSHLPKNKISPASNSGAEPDKNEELANIAVDKDHVRSTATVGSKVEVMFSNGPAAGSKAKFWIQENSETSHLEMPGYRTLGLNTPLGEAIEGAVSGEECRYTVNNVARRVVVTCID